MSLEFIKDNIKHGIIKCLTTTGRAGGIMAIRSEMSAVFQGLEHNFCMVQYDSGGSEWLMCDSLNIENVTAPESSLIDGMWHWILMFMFLFWLIVLPCEYKMKF